MRKVASSALLILQLLLSGCLTTYYSAKLPETWVMQAGIGGSAYKLPFQKIFPYENLYVRMGLPFQSDIGINVFLASVMPYAAGLSIRKQFNIYQCPFINTKFNVEAEVASGPVSGGYGLGIGFLVNDISLIGKLSRCSTLGSWDSSNGTRYGYNAITFIVSYDWKWKRLHLVPFILFSAMGEIAPDLTIPVYKEWIIDYATKNYTGGITVYFDF